MTPDLTSVPQENAVPLQEKIRLLVQRFYQHDQALPNVCRELCRLACQHHVPAEEFRKRLVRAGLAASRASELKQVLRQTPLELEKFLRSENPLSWRVALGAARRSAAEHRTPAAQILARIAGLMHRHKTEVARTGGFELRLRPAPSPFEPQELGHG